MAAADSSRYAITVTDTLMAATFLTTMANYLDNCKWKESSAIGKAFKKAYVHFENGNPDKRNYAYDMAMAAVLNEFNTGGLFTIYSS
ncbi:MAG: hypothetical protein WBB11_04600 [Ferruginibacter sp.]|nr:hypothetical protein [Chitinophagaceae bacterium]